MELAPVTSRQLERARSNPKFTQGCPTCRGEGTYFYRGNHQPCDCKTQKQLFVRYLGANIGSIYHPLGYDDFFEDSEYLSDVIREYVSQFEHHLRYGSGLTFYGDLGSGKSFSAALILKELIKRGYSGYFITFNDLLDLQRVSWDDTSSGEFYEIRSAQVLVIDELSGAKAGTSRGDFLAESFERIIRYRNANAMPTIITTNLTREMENKHHPKAASLLSNSQRRIEAIGPDARRGAARDRTFDLVKAGEIRPIV